MGNFLDVAWVTGYIWELHAYYELLTVYMYMHVQYTLHHLTAI